MSETLSEIVLTFFVSYEFTFRTTEPSSGTSEAGSVSPFTTRATE